MHKKARTALNTLSGTSSTDMVKASMETNAIMDKDLEHRNQQHALLCFQTRAESLREAVKLCQELQDEAMIREAKLELIAHLRSKPEAQKSAAGSSQNSASPCNGNSSHGAAMASSASPQNAESATDAAE